MDNCNDSAMPVFLPVLEESDEKEDLLLHPFDIYRYEYESVQRAGRGYMTSLNS